MKRLLAGALLAVAGSAQAATVWHSETISFDPYLYLAEPSYYYDRDTTSVTFDVSDTTAGGAQVSSAYVVASGHSSFWMTEYPYRAVDRQVITDRQERYVPETGQIVEDVWYDVVWEHIIPDHGIDVMRLDTEGQPPSYEMIGHLDADEHGPLRPMGDEEIWGSHEEGYKYYANYQFDSRHGYYGDISARLDLQDLALLSLSDTGRLNVGVTAHDGHFRLNNVELHYAVSTTPLPGAAWLFGSAVIGGVSWAKCRSRRRLA